jgi:hypothetical protein
MKRGLGRSGSTEVKCNGYGMHARWRAGTFSCLSEPESGRVAPECNQLSSPALLSRFLDSAELLWLLSPGRLAAAVKACWCLEGEAPSGPAASPSRVGSSCPVDHHEGAMNWLGTASTGFCQSPSPSRSCAWRCRSRSRRVRAIGRNLLPAATLAGVGRGSSSLPATAALYSRL